MANRLERAERGSRCSAEHAEGNQSVELGLDPGCRHGQWPKLGDRFAAFGHHDGPAPSHLTEIAAEPCLELSGPNRLRNQAIVHCGYRDHKRGSCQRGDHRRRPASCAARSTSPTTMLPAASDDQHPVPAFQPALLERQALKDEEWSTLRCTPSRIAVLVVPVKLAYRRSSCLARFSLPRPFGGFERHAHPRARGFGESFECRKARLRRSTLEARDRGLRGAHPLYEPA